MFVNVCVSFRSKVSSQHIFDWSKLLIVHNTLIQSCYPSPASPIFERL